MRGKISVDELKEDIVRQIELVPESGVTGEYGGWTSKRDEQERLQKLHSEICYFMNDYG